MNVQGNPNFNPSRNVSMGYGPGSQGTPLAGNVTLDYGANAGKIPVGTVIEGRYEVLSVLGTGGFATVYRARQLRINQDIALKVMDNQRGVDPTYQERFFREAQIAAKIHHNNVVKVFDYGMIGQVQQPYIAMELLQGHDLCHELEHHGPLSPRRTFRLFRPVLDALGVGHQMGIVHKDLKPENLFMTDIGTPRECMKILDFGVARIESARMAKLTGAGQLLGTPQYLAPEYIREQIVSPAIDVYQIALIMSEALTGITAVASDPFAAMMQHCEGKLRIADFLLEGEIGNVFYKAVAINPKERYANADEFGQALDSIECYFESDEPIEGAVAPDQTSAASNAPTPSKAIAVTGNIRPISTTKSLIALAPLQQNQNYDNPTQAVASPMGQETRAQQKLFYFISAIVLCLMTLIAVILVFVIQKQEKKENTQSDHSNIEGSSDKSSDQEKAEEHHGPFKFTVDMSEFYRQNICDDDDNCKNFMDSGKSPEIPIYILNPSAEEVLYDLDCDGDGTYEQKGLTQNSVCKYEDKTGTHQISIMGKVPGLILCGEDEYGGEYEFSNNFGPISVDAWGSIEWRTMHNFARNCANLKIAAKDSPNLKHVQDMSSMFENAGKMNEPIGHWDVSKVRNMDRVFYGAESFNQPLNDWDVSGVRTMEVMFMGAGEFNQPLDRWDVSGVTSMKAMFAYAREFNQPLEAWDVSHVTSMESTFTEAVSFNQPLGAWDVSSVQSFEGMFRGATAFNQPLNGWNVSMAKTMEGMFNRASSFNQPLDQWITFRVTNTRAMFWGAKSFDQNLDSWDMSSNQNMGDMFHESGMTRMPSWHGEG